MFEMVGEWIDRKSTEAQIIWLAIMGAVNWCIYDYVYNFVFRMRIVPILNMWWRGA